MRFPAEKWKTRASRGAGVGWDSLRSARVWGGGRGSVRRGGENPQKAAEFLPRAGPGGVTCSPSRCFPRDPSRGEARAPERREEEGWASGELAADAGFPAAGFPRSRVLFDPELPPAAPRFSAPFSLPGGCTSHTGEQPEVFLGCRGVWLCFLLPFASQMGHLAL